MTSRLSHFLRMRLCRGLQTMSPRFFAISQLQKKSICKFVPNRSIFAFPSSYHCSNTQYRQLHLSSRQNAPVPFAVITLAGRKVMKVVAALFGRAFRKWYFNLPPDKQRLVYEWFMRNRRKILISGACFSGLGVVYFVSHLEKTPITGRRRFVALTKAQHDKIAEFELEQQIETLRNKFLPAHDLRVREVKSVAKKLLAGNSDIKEIKEHDWQVFVVNQPEVANAYVVPTGQIFFFTGMLNTLENEDQIGIILAHEMAHTVLGHGVEQLSHTRFIDWLLIVSLAAIWALMPSDSIAAVSTWFYNFVINAIMELPYSRKLELEADAVGLQLAAKACFDVRESYAYWLNMETMTKTGESNVQPPDILSTHPNHGDRAERLDVIIPEAMELRKACNCAPLKHRDPRTIADVRAKLVERQLAAAGRI